MKSSVFIIKDLPVAAYLAYKRIKMVAPWDSLTRSWAFDDTDLICQRLELEVRNGEALVSVLDYESARKNILSMVR